MNESGSVSFQGMIFMLLMLLLFLGTGHQILSTHKEINRRSHAYLCFKYQIVSMKNYVKTMAKINRILRTTFVMKQSSIPYLAQTATAVHTASLQWQLFTHLRYLKRVVSNHYCSRTEALYFIPTSPYNSTGPLLSRLPDGTSILRRPTWKIIYQHKEIILQAKLYLKNSLDTDLSFSSKEVYPGALLNWNLFSGQEWL